MSALANTSDCVRKRSVRMSSAAVHTRCEFEIALEDFKKNARLGPKELEDFRFADLNSLRSTIESIQAKQEKERRMQNMKRLEPFLKTMEEYAHSVDVFVNTSEILAFVWVGLHCAREDLSIDSR